MVSKKDFNIDLIAIDNTLHLRYIVAIDSYLFRDTII